LLAGWQAHPLAGVFAVALSSLTRTGSLTALFASLAACGGGSARTPDTGVIVTPPPPPTPTPPPPSLVSSVRAAARPISGTDQDYDDIIAAAAPARRVLLGESTHGTHEYYRERGRISERLAASHDFQAIAIEGDWTPTFRVNLYVRGLGTDRSADEALSGYARFPLWMWPNTAFRDFVERLRALNLTWPAEQRVGLYGMDVYDLYDAADFVVATLQQTDPAAAVRVQAQYQCFAPYDRDTDAYGAATRNPARSCQKEAAAAVAEVAKFPRPAGAEAAERHFAMVRSAASVAEAEEYFRVAYTGSMSWNVRDTSMERNVEAIAGHAEALSGQPSKIVVWAHNSHVGDARATSVVNRGEITLGQLMRQRHGDAAFLLGSFSYTGTVFAAPAWGAEGRVYTVLPALPGSHEALFHDTGVSAFSLLLRGNSELGSPLAATMLQRAIGVIYLPETERPSHYFDARLSQQFDAVIFFDQSQAITPLRP
jgi:erythromycin esterase-like protein